MFITLSIVAFVGVRSLPSERDAAASEDACPSCCSSCCSSRNQENAENTTESAASEEHAEEAPASEETPADQQGTSCCHRRQIVKYIIMVGVILPVGTGVMPDFAEDTFDGSSEKWSTEDWIKKIHFFCIVAGILIMGGGEFVGFLFSCTPCSCCTQCSCCTRQMRHPHFSRYYKAMFVRDHAPDKPSCKPSCDNGVFFRFLIQIFGWVLLAISVGFFFSVGREDVPAHAICIKLPPTQCEKLAYNCTSCVNQTSNPYKCELDISTKPYKSETPKHNGKTFERKVSRCYNPACNFEDNAVAMAAEYAMLWISVVNLLCHVINRHIELGHEDTHMPNENTGYPDHNPDAITQNSNSYITQMRVPVDEPILLRAMSPLKISSGATGIQIELDSDRLLVSPRPSTDGVGIVLQ